MEDNRLNPEVIRLKEPWLHNDNSIWLASSVSLQRNIEKFKFPIKLDIERKQQIINLVGKEHLALQPASNPKLLKAEELNFFDKEYLVEHFLTISNFFKSDVGEAFIVDDTGTSITIFNIVDHLSFYAIDTKGDLEAAWGRIIKLESGLGKNYNYAFSPKFGYLTSSLDLCGTALQVTTFLQLSALLHLGEIETIIEKEVDENFNIMGMQGSPTEIIGDVFAIQNNYSIGVTEENIVASMRSLTAKLLIEEKKCRLSIHQSKNALILDKISRAYGILFYSYQIDAIEALNAISLCKLGVSLGWISGISEHQLNLLFFNCRRAHLIDQFKEKISPEEIPHKRAEFIHKALKESKLLV